MELRGEASEKLGTPERKRITQDRETNHHEKSPMERIDPHDERRIRIMLCLSFTN